jgi:hypothetical protein
MITEYKLVSYYNNESAQMDDAINKLLAEGWELYGSASTAVEGNGASNIVFTQPMVKKEMARTAIPAEADSAI